MQEQVTATMAEFLERTARSRHWSGGRFVFRGVADAQYELVPAIGRTPPPPPYARYRTQGPSARATVEREALEMFASRCIAYLDQKPANLLEAMFHAQHHGLPTRLLDWTFSPLIALYFAVTETSVDVDGAVFVHLPNQRDLLADAPERIEVDRDPLAIQRNYLVVPPYVNRRLAAQQGCFTLHADPLAPLPPAYGYRLRIPKDAKVQLWRELDHMGIGSGVVFPDLDGLARSVKHYHFGPFFPYPVATDGHPDPTAPPTTLDPAS